MRKYVFCVGGMSYFGQLASRVLKRPLSMEQPVPGCDVVHIVGMYDPPTYDVTLQATQAARHRVIHWCGSDVEALQVPGVLPEAIHVCDSEGLRRELWDKGVKATTIPWPAGNHFEVTPLPEKPTVAVYFGSDPSRYGGDLVAALEAAMPDVRFVTYMYGHYDADGMREVVDSSSVYLRLTRHDGGAMSAKEFMEAGRRAVITQELPFASTVRVDDFIGIREALCAALAETEPDTDAAEYWREQNSDKRFLGQVDDLLKAELPT